MKVFILLTIVFMATAASASPEKAVQRFVAAGDAQDVAAKKFGGDTRQVPLESVHHLGKFSLALVRIKGKKGSFRSAYTLMKVGST